MIKFPKQILRPALIGLAVTAGLLFSYFRVFEVYELQTYDLRCQLRGPRPISDKIVLVDIYDDALQELGAWPFDRQNHSHLIDYLSSSGAKAVAFDILFSEHRENDEWVVDSAKKAGNVYFANTFSGFDLSKKVITANKVDTEVLPDYRSAARGVGFVNSKADIDGKRRRTIPVVRFEGKDYMQLSFLVAMDELGLKPDDYVIEPKKYIQLGNKVRVPLDEENCMSISYAGLWEKSFEHISYLDLLRSMTQQIEGRKPDIDPSHLKDRIFIVGLTSTGSHDTNAIPIQSVYPMVGSYANTLNTILMNDFIYRCGRWINLLILMAIAGVSGYLSLRYRPIKAFLVTCLIEMVFILGSVSVFFLWGTWIDLFYPVVCIFVIYASCTFIRAISELKKRELMENELKIASQIQKSFLPEALPELSGFSVAVYMKPAKAVGGDLYTFLKLSESKVGVMVGDVSGKGTPAALFMGKTVSEFKYSARDRQDPAEVLMELNNAISAESTGGLFVTMTYAIFDLGTRKMLLSNGGHLPVAVARQGQAPELVTADDGMPIGVMGGMPYGGIERAIASGEVFAFYSDGVSEARNRKKDEFGIERLQALMDKCSNLSAQEILDYCIKDLNVFMGKADQHDDITLIIVKIGDS